MSTVILIAGPTASGKSALALELAAKLRGVIINADSMQVYRDLRIITARPTPDEEKRISHRLYGHVDAAENYSVGRWFGEAAAALTEALRRRQPAIVAGGTGLYFSTLTRGIAAVPPIPPEIRRDVRGRLMAVEPVRYALFLVRRGPRGNDAQITINLHGIRVDDDAAQLCREFERPSRLAARRRACNENDRRHAVRIA